MVSDKFQVRATGPINRVHRQPIKGRKVHGGIRFGEMERDSLLAHGASFLLNDRLMQCSDFHTTKVCAGCGSLISCLSVGAGSKGSMTGSASKNYCSKCEHGKKVVTVPIPYVFVYLVNELAAMNIRMTLKVN